MATGFNRLGSAAYADIKPESAIHQSVTIEQKVAAIKEAAKQALLNVALNRKKLYDIIVDIKEHFHEYGFKSAAAGVETLIPRSKSWANKFCAEIESELEICKVANFGATEADSSAKDKSETLNKISELPEPSKEEEPEEKPHIKTRDEILAEQNGQTEARKPKPRTENGVPKSQLGVWKKTEDSFGILIRSVDDVHRACPNSFRHDQVLHALNGALSFFNEWRKSVK